MLSLPSRTKMFLYIRPVDMRKSFDGLFQFRGLDELGVQFGYEARRHALRFSPDGTACCSHGREPVVGIHQAIEP